MNLFVYFWLRWVFVAARRLSLVAASGGYSLLWCVGFSLWWLLLLRSTGSRSTGFSSCGARAQLLCGMWDPPGPGLEPVPPGTGRRILNRSATREIPISFLKGLLVLFPQLSSFSTFS